MANATTGRNVNWVDFGNLGDRQKLGTFRQVGLHQWKEDGEKSGRDLFDLTETGRDEWSVYLFDNSRKVCLQIDLFKNIVYYSDPNTERREQYAIVASSSTPTGWLANRVEVGASPADVQGVFKQVGAKAWTEDRPDGSTIFNLTETGRDDWSVYLLDESRNVRLQLDLFRSVVLYASDADPLTDLYKVAVASTKLNGWLVNLVEFDAGGAKIAGSYRQTGIKTWVEDSVVFGTNQFEFHETARDEWSVYLHDASRNVSLQLDLHTRIVYYADGAHPRRELYSISRVDMLPRFGLDNGKTVNLVEFGDASGNVIGHFRQTSETEWSEDNAINGRDVFRFREIARDEWSVYMLDTSRDTWIQLDLFTRKITTHVGGAKPAPLYEILSSSSTLNGWLANYATFSNGGEILGMLLQTGWTTWVEESLKEGGTIYHFDETGRTDWTVDLHDSSRNVNLRIDLSSKKILYGVGDEPLRDLYRLEIASHKGELWRRPHKITSRSTLTEDYEVGSKGQKPTPKPVYRTSVSFPIHVSCVDVWASEEVTLEINEKTYTVDKVRSVRVSPSALSKLTISMLADKLGCPQIFLRTNLMKADQRHILMPDVEVHKKICSLRDGEMWEARTQLGISPSYDRAHTEDLQKALKNIAAAAQYSYNETSHGIHHDRALYPANMDDAHFMMDFSGGGTKYSALSKDEVLQFTQNARRIDGAVAQSIFGDIGDFFKSATHIIVHTVEKVAHDVVDTVEHAATDVVHTVHDVGEDLIHGDILGAGEALVSGGENLGKDLFKGAKDTVGDTLSGAGQVLAITLKLGGKLAGDAVQFIIHHTGFIGEALGSLLDKAGVYLGKAIAWLSDKVGWEDVIHTHDVLLDMINKKLDQGAAYPQELKKRADKFFTELAKALDDDIDKALASFDVAKIGSQSRPASSHSGAVEKVEWLLGKWFYYTKGVESPVAAFDGSSHAAPLSEFATIIEDKIGHDGGKVKAAFGDAFEHLLRIFSDPKHAPEHIIGAALELARAVGRLGLEIVGAVLDALLDMLSTLISQFKSMANAEWNIPFLSAFYEGLTGGRKMSLVSIVALMIATPMTIIHKAVEGKRPFDGVGAALGLAPLADVVKSLGYAYGSSHLILALVATANDLSQVKKDRAERAKKAAARGTPLQEVPQDGFASSRSDDESFDDGFVSANSFDDEFSTSDSFEIDAAGAGEVEAIAGPALAENVSAFERAVMGLNILLGFGAQMTGAPMVPGSQYAFPLDEAKDDVFEAPGYWANVIWWYQWGLLGFDLCTSVGLNLMPMGGAKASTFQLAKDAVAGFNGVRGIAHACLMGVLDQADRKKREALSLLLDTTDFQTKNEADALGAAVELENAAIKHLEHKPYRPVADMNLEDAKKWLEDLANYYAWSKDVSPGQGLPNKTFGNVMDALPEIGQFGLIKSVVELTEGWSLVGVGVMDVFGNMSESVTVCVRSGRNELL